MVSQQDFQLLVNNIKAEAFRLGFCLCGITDLKPMTDFEVYRHWIEQGNHAGMEYLASDYHLKMRRSPSLLDPDARSVIVLGWPYTLNRQDDPRTGWIAGYASGQDYHQFLPLIAENLVCFIQTQVAVPIHTKIVTDSSPLLERELGQRAGLGWIGRNSCLISPESGSSFLLAEILTDLVLPPDPPFPSDRCGTCHRCMDHCPTLCILENRTIDARKCIAYQTIENKGQLSEELRTQLGNWLFGCDVCQTVCPWNQPKHHPHNVEEGNVNLTPEKMLHDLSLSAEDFKQDYAQSPLLRAKWQGYLRNLINVLVNIHETRALPILISLASQVKEPLLNKMIRDAISSLSQSNPLI